MMMLMIFNFFLDPDYLPAAAAKTMPLPVKSWNPPVTAQLSNGFLFLLT